jgi:predicted AlkP superfamily pyrophosphatase or phosphodiesterase
VIRLRGALLAAALALAGCATPRSAPPVATTVEAAPPVTILISIDGFRADYLDRGVTPTLSRLAREGVRAAMTPAFPTKTFPNHYTIVTGLSPDAHGIVDNRMADPARPGELFTLGSAQSFDPFWWDAAEPIWVTAERQGVRTATMFWPGTEVAIRGVRPSNWQRFDQNVSNPQRVEQVLDWLRRPPATRPRFITLYFNTVDSIGHRHGPDAPETNAAMAEVDARIGDLVAGIAQLGQRANLVITADHGMTATVPWRTVPLGVLVDPALVEVVTDGPYAGLNPRPGQAARVAAQLARPLARVACWPRDAIPPALRYGRNPRVPAFLCLAEPGWLIVAPGRRPGFGGTHGYDQRTPDMAALFIAHGPDIVPGAAISRPDAVDVYPLLAGLLGVTPRANEGDAAVLAPALRPR